MEKNIINGEINLVERYRPRLLQTAIPSIFQVANACGSATKESSHAPQAATPPKSPSSASTSNVILQQKACPPPLMCYPAAKRRKLASDHTYAKGFFSFFKEGEMFLHDKKDY